MNHRGERNKAIKLQKSLSFFVPFPRCNEGWEGPDCLTCQRLPGCLNGDCDGDRPNTCRCRQGWAGHLCDQPICREGCHDEHGYCEEVQYA